MSDSELARAFERHAMANADFHHASHLRVAWVYLRECASLTAATDRMAAELRMFAAAAGKADRYHYTLTAFWMAALACAGGRMTAATADEVLKAHPSLLDKELPLAFYSRERLFCD